MKYLLFVNFNSGLMHNTIHEKLEHVLESIEQLIESENLNIKNEKIPNITEFKECLNKNDDYFKQLSNGTWYHIQPKNIFEVVK